MRNFRNSSEGVTLDDLVMDNEYTLGQVFERQNTNWTTSNLTHQARILIRILQHNLITKTSSFDEIYPLIRKAMYVIIRNIRVNWVHAIMDNMIENRLHEKRRYNLYGKLIVMILHRFRVSLDDEIPLRHHSSTTFDNKVLKGHEDSYYLRHDSSRDSYVPADRAQFIWLHHTFLLHACLPPDERIISMLDRQTINTVNSGRAAAT